MGKLVLGIAGLEGPGGAPWLVDTCSPNSSTYTDARQRPLESGSTCSEELSYRSLCRSNIELKLLREVELIQIPVVAYILRPHSAIS
jgi:hypothetical protein